MRVGLLGGLVASWSACGKSVYLDGDQAEVEIGLVNSGDPEPTGSSTGDETNPADSEVTKVPSTEPAPSDPVDPVPPDGACRAEDQFRKTFVQPDVVVNRSVDLLFVLDASSSLDAQRRKILDELDAFTTSLDAAGDYRIAVLLGHGGASASSGRLLVADAFDQAVLDSRVHSPARIRDAMLRKLARRFPDADQANGEALLYSFDKLLDRASAVQAQGFLRPEAAWSVIFVTDENDICFRPELHGYSSFPDYVPAATDIERIAYRRYCLDTSGSPTITPQRTLTKLMALQPARPVALGGIVHFDPALTPRRGEEAIAHGVVELVRSHDRATLISLGAPSYRTGLTTLADLSTTSLALKTEFDLGAGVRLAPESVQTKVDGAPVPSVYAMDQAKITIDLLQAGRALSEVEVVGCLTR